MKTTITTGKHFRKPLVFLIMSILAFPACNFDGWPEPDSDERDDSPSDSTTGQSDADSDADANGDLSKDSDAGVDLQDYEEPDTTTESDNGNFGDCPMAEDLPLNYEKIFVSAQGTDNTVTIVGLENAAFEGDTEITIKNMNTNDQVRVIANEDGSFAFRTEAQAGDRLIFFVTGSLEEIAWNCDLYPVTIPVASTFTEDPANTLIVDGIFQFDESTGDSEIIGVRGDGHWLLPNHNVIGANISRATSAMAPVTCTPDCSFHMLLEGVPEDEIVLFIVMMGENSGRTAAETF
jgi:hypothetical protein